MATKDRCPQCGSDAVSLWARLNEPCTDPWHEGRSSSPAPLELGAALRTRLPDNDKQIAALVLEIRNLAHRGWEDRPNAEFLFREIGQKAHRIGQLLDDPAKWPAIGRAPAEPADVPDDEILIDVYASEGAPLPAPSPLTERERFEKWVTEMEPAYAASNLERLTGGRGGYRVHNVAIWWMAWQARAEVGDSKHRTWTEVKAELDRQEKSVE